MADSANVPVSVVVISELPGFGVVVVDEIGVRVVVVVVVISGRE